MQSIPQAPHPGYSLASSYSCPQKQRLQEGGALLVTVSPVQTVEHQIHLTAGWGHVSPFEASKSFMPTSPLSSVLELWLVQLPSPALTPHSATMSSDRGAGRPSAPCVPRPGTEVKRIH